MYGMEDSINLCRTVRICVDSYYQFEIRFTIVIYAMFSSENPLHLLHTLAVGVARKPTPE